MTASLAERIVNRVARQTERLRPNRRGFLGGAALVGAALTVDPLGYLTRPASAYDSVCGSDNTCSAGYTVFCCTINGGSNTCPPDSFIGGWWKADNSNFCGGNARYYIDCNAYRDGKYTCHCNSSTCDQRRVACNQFRYGQCNTQIPWSNTGPVLCRVVSCTPPWVQYGGTCSSSSATDNNTATHSAPCLTGNVPVGVVEEVSCVGNTVHVKGWAYDPDSPSTSLSVSIYQDGKGLMGIHASLPRPDVNSSRHITGKHGFSASFQASSGHHTFTVFAMNIKGGSGNPRIGGKTIIVNPGAAPTGKLELCSPAGDSVVIRGWAYDRDSPSTSIAVNIYQDDKPLMGIHTAIDRADVNSHYKISGKHGFEAQFRPKPGRHNYKVYAMNVGGGSTNTLIGNHSLIVKAQSAPTAQSASSDSPDSQGSVALPAGALESATVSGAEIRLSGWAQDPARPDEQLGIAVYEDSPDGSALHWYPTGSRRPELRESHGIGGRPGFEIGIPAGAGVHTYTVYALLGAAAETGADEPVEHRLLGTRTVRVGQNGAIGRVNGVEQLPSGVRLTGWAYDPDAPASEVSVAVFRDGARMSGHATGGPHPELAGTDGALGRHGFDITVPDEPGPHTYTVYAESAAGRRMIGGRTTSDAGQPPAELTPVVSL